MKRTVLLLFVFVLSVQSATCPVATYDVNGALQAYSKPIGYYNPGLQYQVSFVTSAICRIKETILNPTPITGFFKFDADPGNPSVENGDGQTTLNTAYSVNGLTDGDHKYHVHNYGDIFSPDGATVENHFVGQTNLRPAGGPQEVGLLNQGTPVQNTDGDSATGSFPDHAADLTGHNSILGRAIIIHGDGGPDPLAKAAQCVIGWTADNPDFTYTETNTITRASATLERLGSSTVGGEVQFEINEWGTIDVKIFATGLTPSASYYLTVMDKGDITATAGANMGNIFQGTPRYPISGGRSLIGEVGATTSTTWPVTANTNGVIRDSITDWEIDLNGLNSIVGRGLLLKTSGGAFAAQGVVGIAKDSTYQDPSSPQGLAYLNSAPMVIEAQAMMTPTSGSSTLFKDGFIRFARLAASDPLYPGVRVRYHLIVTTTKTNHSLTIRSKGQFGGAPTSASSDISSDAIFSGFFSGRESIYSQVGMVNNGVGVSSDANGIISGEFVDRSLWLGDYNSIIGRHIALSAAGAVDLDHAIALGVIGRTVTSGTKRDYPAPVVTTAECALTGSVSGVLTLTQPTPTSAVTVTYSGISATGAFGVAPRGDIWGSTTAGYLLAGTGVRNLGPSCMRAYEGALGDFPASGASFVNISLSGPDTIIGRTLFVSVDGNYYTSAPGGSNPVLGTQARAGQCVVGIVTETDITPTGTGIHILPSVYSAGVVVPPTITGSINSASSAVVSVALLISTVLLTLML